MAQVRVFICTGYVFKNMTDINTIITIYKNNRDFFVIFNDCAHFL